MPLIRLALPVPLARYFDYLLPPDFTAEIGVRVVVPFGRQEKIGVVVGFPTESEVPADKLKPIIKVLDNQSLFAQEMWHLLEWSANYYHAPFGEVLASSLPVKLRQGDSTERQMPEVFQLTEQGQKALANGVTLKAKKQHQLLCELADFAEFFPKPTACSPAVWKVVQEKGYVAKLEITFEPQHWQTALKGKPICNAQNCLRLNKQQSLVVSSLSYHSGFGAFLLNGVTN